MLLFVLGLVVGGFATAFVVNQLNSSKVKAAEAKITALQAQIVAAAKTVGTAVKSV